MPVKDHGRAHARTRHAHLVVDVLVEPGSHDEDRVAVVAHDATLSFVVADGAGNSGRGRTAAERAIALAAHPGGDLVERLATLDLELARLGAETAVVAAELDIEGALVGAASGDVRLWACARGEWRELTTGTPRKPLLGAGASPRRLFARRVEAVLCASDGLAAWPGPEMDPALLTTEDAVLRLAEFVRLPNGRLVDDLSIVWVRPAAPI